MVLNRIKDMVGTRLDELSGLFSKEVDSLPNYSKEKYRFNVKDKDLIKLKDELFGDKNYVKIQERLEKDINF